MFLVLVTAALKNVKFAAVLKFHLSGWLITKTSTAMLVLAVEASHI